MATAQPQEFEDQLKGRKKGRFWRGLGFASLITVGGMIAYGTLTTNGQMFTKDVTSATTVMWDVQQNPDLIFDNVGDNHVNVLLVGEDRNWKETMVYDQQRKKMVRWHVIDEDSPPRSDTMIVVSLDRTTTPPSIRMISFPRDARVRWVDLDGRRHKGKMNSVYSSGGNDPKKREEVLRNFFRDEMGIRIDRVARIRIEGFTGLIDQVGGLEINVDGALEMDRNGRLYRGPIKREDKYGQWKVDLKPGLQHLNGEEAVGYARFRVDREGDPGRIRRQQQVMRALAKEITSKPLMQLPGLVKEVKQQFQTDMTDQELASMALFTKNTGAGTNIQPLTVFGAGARTGNRGDIILNKPDNIKLFATIFGASFNPTNFLNRSPETTQDELGRTNNRSPAAQEILRQAGLLDEKELGRSNAVEDAPVRN